MSNITDAIMGVIDTDTAVNREVLKAAVMRQITCPRSGRVLDVRSAVYFHVTTPNGKAAAECVDGAVWDVVKDAVTAVCQESSITLEVIDGRVVSARKH